MRTWKWIGATLTGLLLWLPSLCLAANDAERAFKNPTVDKIVLFLVENPILLPFAGGVALLATAYAVASGGTKTKTVAWKYEILSAEPEQVDHFMRKATEPLSTGEVTCSIYAPQAVAPATDFIIQAVLHFAADTQAADTLATGIDFDTALKTRSALFSGIDIGDEIEVRLISSQMQVDQPVQKVRWQGVATSVPFVAKVTGAVSGGAVARFNLILKGVPIGTAVVSVAVAASPAADRMVNLGTTRRHRKAFLSYASPDRAKVLERNQILKAVGIETFQDVVSLEPGQRWERQLYRHIDDCDLFLLFWSQAARNSEWVIKEAEYALKRADADSEEERLEFVPIILEGPPVVPPPPSLQNVHFNDPLRYLISAQTQAPPK